MTLMVIMHSGALGSHITHFNLKATDGIHVI